MEVSPEFFTTVPCFYVTRIAYHDRHGRQFYILLCLFGVEPVSCLSRYTLSCEVTELLERKRKSFITEC